jgi:hypothetical protein
MSFNHEQPTSCATRASHSPSHRVSFILPHDHRSPAIYTLEAFLGPNTNFRSVVPQRQRPERQPRRSNRSERECSKQRLRRLVLRGGERSRSGWPRGSRSVQLLCLPGHDTRTGIRGSHLYDSTIIVSYRFVQPYGFHCIASRVLVLPRLECPGEGIRGLTRCSTDRDLRDWQVRSKQAHHRFNLRWKLTLAGQQTRL